MFSLITDVLRGRKEPLYVVCHHPLNLLIADRSLMSPEEKAFVATGLSHLDFLIYNTVITRQGPDRPKGIDLRITFCRPTECRSCACRPTEAENGNN